VGGEVTRVSTSNGERERQEETGKPLRSERESERKIIVGN